MDRPAIDPQDRHRRAHDKLRQSPDDGRGDCFADGWRHLDSRRVARAARADDVHRVRTLHCRTYATRFRRAGAVSWGHPGRLRTERWLTRSAP